MAAKPLKLEADRVSHVALKALQPDPHNPRAGVSDKSLAELVASIKARGILVPLQVRFGEKNQIIVKDGHRRLRAAQLAKVATVPVQLVKTEEPAQVLLDQAAVNNVREELRPMDVARLIGRLRDVHKLHPNQIVERLQKQGFKDMTRGRVDRQLRLLELPAWAAEMIDAGELPETGAEQLLAAHGQPAILKSARKILEQRIGFAGRLSDREVIGCVSSAFRDGGAVDLSRTQEWDAGQKNAVHFNPTVACKGCEWFREVGRDRYCVNRQEFDKKNADAKAAGLLPGGKKPKPKVDKKGSAAAPAPEPAEVKAERRERSLEEKSRDYLHAWAIERLCLRVYDHDLRRLLMLWSAIERPGVDGEYGGHAWQRRGVIHKGAKAMGLASIEDVITGFATPPPVEAAQEFARTIVRQLPWREAQVLGRFLLGHDLTGLYTIDRAYLDLLRKPELVAIAEKRVALAKGAKAYGALKLDELKVVILAARDSLPVPPALQRIWDDVEPPEPAVDDGDDEPWPDDPEAGETAEVPDEEEELEEEPA